MAKIEIYTTPICGFCQKAKRLLTEKAVEYIEIDLFTDSDRRAEMIKRANGSRTVPQIFINGAHIGGCDDLYAIDRSGNLDQLLS